MYYPYYDNNQRKTNELALNIAKAIDGEYSAIACYKEIENLAKNKTDKKIIHEIRNDEKKHFQTFSQLYTQLTGQQHTPKITEPCPKMYKEALDFAFHDEQEAVDFYLDIAYQSNNPLIKEAFTRAAMDEQNHAVWFLYLLR
ncbi:ferritin family protein [Niallia sp. 01092]|uniref:ferritin family protein n=1 Tax=unclassified Niallia TaxID=2837522 RepID=UPI003FD286E3